ncbi:hypothetical protein D770_01940 [Flammeovirgaceae bacterium 311]|nr:hypothetical protein D770_01940 [Flammeovirgaceae bacterium 311]
MEDEEDDESLGNPDIPLVLKGKEIYDLSAAIVAIIPDDDDVLSSFKEFVLEDAMVLYAKVVSAEATEFYDLKMESAAIIRKAARDLLTHCSGLEMFGFRETHYLELIRAAIEEYRLLFLDWVKGFDQWNYVIDRWGLFNPPGVDANDHDPDEDLPPE